MNDSYIFTASLPPACAVDSLCMARLTVILSSSGYSRHYYFQLLTTT